MRTPSRNRRRHHRARATWTPADRIVGEAERAVITGYSRNWWWQLERQGKVPARIKLGARKVGWKLSELTAWLDKRADLRDAGGDDARPAA